MKLKQFEGGIGAIPNWSAHCFSHAFHSNSYEDIADKAVVDFGCKCGTLIAAAALLDAPWRYPYSVFYMFFEQYLGYLQGLLRPTDSSRPLHHYLQQVKRRIVAQKIRNHTTEADGRKK
ncbi:uncharacterized protein LOC18013578 isoform X2 [Eutrema salsugineum]|nr:uncharacterized protein LOC18013578 isoform X2 [Eutrema salsugineum]